MRLFGFEIARAKAQTLSAVHGSGGGWFGVIREAWAGAFQQHVTIDAPRNVLAFSAVYSCVTGIASDIAKLWIDLVEIDGKGVSTYAVPTSPYWAVLRKPNRYQTRLKFIEQWIVSKLLHGNTYVLKERDARGIVVAMYVLDAQRVTPLVAESGDVYYKLSTDHLSGLEANITVPASEIMHDMMVSLWHPLVGVSPIYACGLSATMGNRIQSSSTLFFANSSRPSGILVTPGSISDEDAASYKRRWEENYSGANAGRTAVLGNGLKYETIAIPAEQSQLIEQLKWTVEDVARAFRYPLYKLGGSIPVGSTVETLGLVYYCDCLQPNIESVEACLDDGLGLRKPDVNYYAQFDIEGLVRMDMAAQMKMLADSVKGVRTPNEARAKIGLKPVVGGDAVYMQQQEFSTEALAKRDALADPFAKSAPAAAAANDETAEQQAAAFFGQIAKEFACPT